MEIDSTQIASFLARQFLFQGLSADELARLANRFEVETWQSGSVICPQEARPSGFYIVYQGKLVAGSQNRQISQRLYTLGQGDLFGEEALLHNHPSPIRVEVLEPAVVLKLTPLQFSLLMQEYPQIRKLLIGIANSRHLARLRAFDWLTEGEIIYLITQKHLYFLFRSLVLPVLFLVASLPMLAFGLAELLGEAENMSASLYLLLSGGLFVVGGLWGVWNYLNWANDYYLITNRRVVWLEKVIAIYESRNEASLSTILSVNVTTSLLGRILDFGDLGAKTYTGVIPMRKVNQPLLLAAFIEGFRQLAQRSTRESELQAIEKAVDLEINRRERPEALELKPAVMLPKNLQPLKTQIRKPLSPGERWGLFWRVRYEQDGIITYRKHWFVLLKRVWLPLLACLGMLTLLVSTLFTGLLSSLGWIGWLAWLGLSMFFTGWFIYQAWDWSNDIYRLTFDQILDIERKPLGTEVRKTANLDSILTIEHTRQSLIGILLNFGTVNIMVGETRFDFVGVANPNQVHQDITERQEALKRRRRQNEEEWAREKMIYTALAIESRRRKLGNAESPEIGREF